MTDGRATGHHPGRADRTAASVVLGGLTVFQASLAAGAPWGRLAWGGTHAGTLPPELRVGSGVAAVLWGAATVAIAAELPRSARAQRLLLRGVGGVCAVGAALNLASPSPAERALWAPVSAAVAVLTWRAARGLVVTGASGDRAA
ncbi:MAG TPA: hypothetical protein VLQ78_01470 [Ornithinibacter sp.]|nr:hypothetical protein [Ornithinibacter sp.]